MPKLQTKNNIAMLDLEHKTTLFPKFLTKVSKITESPLMKPQVMIQSNLLFFKESKPENLMWILLMNLRSLIFQQAFKPQQIKS